MARCVFMSASCHMQIEHKSSILAWMCRSVHARAKPVASVAAASVGFGSATLATRTTKRALYAIVKAGAVAKPAYILVRRLEQLTPAQPPEHTKTKQNDKRQKPLHRRLLSTNRMDSRSRFYTTREPGTSCRFYDISPRTSAGWSGTNLHRRPG